MATATDVDADQAVEEEFGSIPDRDAEPEREPDEGLVDGKDITQLADEEPEEKPVPPTQLAIEGTRDKIPRSTGGRAPTESELRIMGGRRPIIGSFEKGERVTLLCDATIRAAEDIDIDDEWGNVSRTIRVHKARQLQVRVASPTTLMRWLINAGYDRAALGILHDEVAAG